MTLRIKAAEASARIRRELEALTDLCRVMVNEVDHDAGRGVLTIPVYRRPCRERPRPLGLGYARRPEGRVLVPCLIEIGAVSKVEIASRLEPSVESVVIQIGLWVRDGTVGLSSLAEDAGVPCYQVTAHVRLCDITIRDVEGGTIVPDPGLRR